MRGYRPGAWVIGVVAAAVVVAGWSRVAAGAAEPAEETRLAARTAEGQVVTGTVRTFDG